MKKRLQVKQPDGRWLWVAMIKQSNKSPITTTSKLRAMPEITYWFSKSIDVMRHKFPDYEFRLAESRDV